MSKLNGRKRTRLTDDAFIKKIAEMLNEDDAVKATLSQALEAQLGLFQEYMQSCLTRYKTYANSQTKSWDAEQGKLDSDPTDRLVSGIYYRVATELQKLIGEAKARTTRLMQEVPDRRQADRGTPDRRGQQPQQQQQQQQESVGEIAKLLRSISELDVGDLPSTDDAPLDKINLKNGYRLVSKSDTPWLSCDDCARRRYKDGILKTDRGLVRVTSISPVDDSSGNCSFCGSQLEPKSGEEDQGQMNQQNLQSLGMDDMAGPPEEGGQPGGGVF